MEIVEGKFRTCYRAIPPSKFQMIINYYSKKQKNEKKTQKQTLKIMTYFFQLIIIFWRYFQYSMSIEYIIFNLNIGKIGIFCIF